MDQIPGISTDRAIEDFWDWFASNSSGLISMYAIRDFNALAEVLNRELDKIMCELAWEIGPGKKKPYLLTISSEGNPALRQIAETMIQFAPELANWEFYSAKPPRHPAGIVYLPERKTQFDTRRWKFIPMERPENGRLDLVILDEQLASADREAALKAVSIYLDELLGEDTVERWIGELRVENPTFVQNERVYDTTEIPDYLYWATHRDSNPLQNL
jgi:hypothetical protein